MAIVAVFNRQVGVGKTTTALNLLAAIARRGERPLGIDLDPDAQLSTLFGARPARAADSIAAFLAGDAALDDVAQITRSGVVLCPAHAELATLSAMLGKGLPALTRLRLALRGAHGYDGPVVIDCGSAWNTLTLNAIFACDLLLVPVAAEPRSEDDARGVERGLDALTPVFKYRLARRYLRTRVASPASAAGDGAAAAVAGLPTAELCATPIHDDPAFAESQAAGLDIFRHAPGSAGARDYGALADELRAWL
jgi:chromosome partitioning protein